MQSRFVNAFEYVVAPTRHRTNSSTRANYITFLPWPRHYVHVWLVLCQADAHPIVNPGIQNRTPRALPGPGSSIQSNPNRPHKSQRRSGRHGPRRPPLPQCQVAQCRELWCIGKSPFLQIFSYGVQM